MRSVVAIAFVCLLATASVLAEDASNEKQIFSGPSLNLVIVVDWEQTEPDARVDAVFRAELARLVMGLGVSPRFVTIAEATQASFDGKIVVLRLTERGREVRRELSAVPANALAWTHAAEGNVTPFGSVDLAALRAFVAIPNPSETPDSQLRFARALSRVAAHEIFHMLTRTMDHGGEGIMQPALSRAQLTREAALAWTPHNRMMALRAFPHATRDDVFAAVTGSEDRNP